MNKKISHREIAKKFWAPETDKSGIEPMLLDFAVTRKTFNAEIDKLDDNTYAQEHLIIKENNPEETSLVNILSRIAAEQVNEFPHASVPSDKSLDADEARLATTEAVKAQLKSRGEPVNDVQAKMEALYQRILNVAQQLRDGPQKSR